jgi:hypothetical protein
MFTMTKITKVKSTGSHRSPRYPFVPLGEAVKRLDEIREFKEESRCSTYALTTDDLSRAWLLKQSSSAFAQTIAALRQYGLLDRRAGEGGQLWLSDLGLRIIMTDRSSVDYSSAVKEAALKPRVFKELWELSAASDLDQRATVEYLIRYRGEGLFTRKGAENLLRIFDETMRYAAVRPSPDDAFTTEHITDEQGQPILLRYRGKASRKRYEFLRDLLDLKIRRLRDSGSP